MTDKEKVLAKWPGAFTFRFTTDNYLQNLIWRVLSKDGAILGSGPTESEAWANAAKGLE